MITPALLATLSALAAEPEGVDRYLPVERASATGGLLDGERAWLRTHGGCLPTTLADESGERQLTVPLCAKDAWRCTWSIPLDATWTFGSTTCTGPDDRGSHSGYGGSHHGLPQLVEHTRARAVWRPVFELHAVPDLHVRELRPCTPESLRALEGSRLATVRDGVRTCDVSTGYAVHPVTRMGGGVGVGERRLPEPVDCRQPCPPNPDLERVRHANAALSERLFASPDGPEIGLYATEAACLAAGPSGPTLPIETCGER